MDVIVEREVGGYQTMVRKIALCHFRFPKAERREVLVLEK
jgi:hypothetical protein